HAPLPNGQLAATLMCQASHFEPNRPAYWPGRTRAASFTLGCGSTTAGGGDVITATDFISGEDTLEFAESIFGDSGLTGTVSLINVAFNTNQATTLTDLTTAAGTDQEGYAVLFTGSNLDNTLYDAVDSAIAAGAAVTGKGFIVLGNGTDTAVLFDGDFSTASSGSLIELVTLTGVADPFSLISDQDLLLY
ncbi:MAG: hypothetical protein MI862_00935, partial [Desulfobacterales bacterium]|nr:hypothetical protein [Desulfobacterales bacterium]